MDVMDEYIKWLSDLYFKKTGRPLNLGEAVRPVTLFGTLEPLDFRYKGTIDSKEAALNLKHLKEYRQVEHDKRAKKIADLSLLKTVFTSDYETKMRRSFKKLVAKKIPDGENINHAVLWEAIAVKKWPEKVAKAVFDDVASDAAYDCLRESPGCLSDDIIHDIKKKLAKDMAR